MPSASLLLSLSLVLRLGIQKMMNDVASCVVFWFPRRLSFFSRVLFSCFSFSFFFFFFLFVCLFVYLFLGGFSFPCPAIFSFFFSNESHQNKPTKNRGQKDKRYDLHRAVTLEYRFRTKTVLLSLVLIK